MHADVVGTRRSADWTHWIVVVHRLQEFKLWLGAKRYHSKARQHAPAQAEPNELESTPSTPGIGSTPEPSSVLRLHRERAELFLIRRRAVEQARRDRAAASAERLVEAEQRRLLLQDLEISRLKQEHQLVLQRLVREGRGPGSAQGGLI
jgi:hypothetical protein